MTRWRAARRGWALRSSVPVAAVLAGLCAEAAPVATRTQASRGWPAWIEAVNAHAPGQRDEPVIALAPWSLADLSPALDGLRRAPGSRTDRPAAEQSAIAERALLLHTDIAILHRTPTGYDLPGDDGGVTLFEDGRAVGQMSRTIHWEFSRRLLDRLPEDTTHQELARRYFRVSAAVLQQWGEYPELTTHLAAARRLLGEDAVLLMYEGTMRQAFAGARMQRFFDERRRAQAASRSGRFVRQSERSVPGPVTVLPDVPAALPSARDSRNAAERLFRRALALDPALHEARIRLAHVLGDAGRHEDAARELAQATTGTLPPPLAYYAALVAGREARALGRFADARGAFERAAAIFPQAPAPRHGLSELAIAAGDRAAAMAHAKTAAEGVRTAADDPWWWLDRAHAPSAEELVRDMRARVAP